MDASPLSLSINNDEDCIDLKKHISYQSTIHASCRCASDNDDEILIVGTAASALAHEDCYNLSY